MENKKSTEAKGDTIMNKEDFAALWKSIRLKVTDTYDVPPEILWGERLHHRDAGQLQRLHRQGEKQEDVQHLRHRCSGTDK